MIKLIKALLIIFPLFIMGQDIVTNNGNIVTNNGNIVTHEVEAFTNTKYIEFGGTDEYLNYASTVNLGTSHSICFWCKSAQSTYGFLMGTYASVANFNLLYIDNLFYYGDNNEYKSTAFTRDNTWKFYCIVRSGTSVKFYEDGSQIGSDQTLSTSGDMSYLWVGRYYTRYTTGSTDEISIYNKVLTVSEMESLYWDGDGTEGLPENCGNPEDITGLIHYLNFEQTITTTEDIITEEVLTNNNMESADIKEY